MHQEKIICAAIWYDDKIKRDQQPKNIKTGIVVCGLRHGDCFNILNELLKNKNVKFDRMLHKQGFITSEYRFLFRSQAYKVAKKSGQINKLIGSILTSEDLY